MPRLDFIHSIQLPELKIVNNYRTSKDALVFEAEKLSEFEVCPKCATPSKTIYDHVSVWIKDTPIRDKRIFLKIKKRRFFCKSCKKTHGEQLWELMSMPFEGIKSVGIESSLRSLLNTLTKESERLCLGDHLENF